MGLVKKRDGRFALFVSSSTSFGSFFPSTSMGRVKVHIIVVKPLNALQGIHVCLATSFHITARDSLSFQTQAEGMGSSIVSHSIRTILASSRRLGQAILALAY